jgi:hypothetical protein
MMTIFDGAFVLSARWQDKSLTLGHNPCDLRGTLKMTIAMNCFPNFPRKRRMEFTLDSGETWRVVAHKLLRRFGYKHVSDVWLAKVITVEPN